MLGFVIGLGTELLTGQGIISQIGFWTGSSKSIFDMDYPLTASRWVDDETPAQFDVRVGINQPTLIAPSGGTSNRVAVITTRSSRETIAQFP